MCVQALGLEGRAAAQSCADASSLWNFATGGGAASSPSNDTSFNAGASIAYVAQGTKVYAINNASGAQYWAPISFSTTVSNFPSPVPLNSGGEYLFIAGPDGLLYKVDASSGAISAKVDTRRGTCSSDTLIATPTVQLYAYSNSTFQTAMNATTHPGDDLVFVITRYTSTSGTSCDTHTRNKIIAYYASDLKTAWTFNGSGTYQMDYGSEGCSVDYDLNRIYCGTNLPDGYFQNTLWAINTTDGSLSWSVNADSLRARPEYKNSKVYVGTYTGTVRVFDPTAGNEGTELWNLSVTKNNISRNIWTEFRGSYSNLMVVTDSSGVLHAINDQGSTGTTAWTTDTKVLGTVKSMAAISPTIGKAYVGLGNGTVHQLDLATGADEATATVGGASDSVYDPSLDTDTKNGATINRLSVAAGSKIKRYCVPWLVGWAGAANQFDDGNPTPCHVDADCPVAMGSCYTRKCDVASGVCYHAPVADGTACDDGNACSCATGSAVNGVCPDTCANCDICKAGTCTSDVYNDTNACTQAHCVSPGDRGCPQGTVCCGNGSCINVKTDGNNCGACGVVCGTDMSCIGGVCRRSMNMCNYTTAMTLAGANLNGADAIAFSRNGNQCSAYVSTYVKDLGQQSGVVQVDPNGMKTTFSNLAANLIPLHGVAVTQNGDHIYGTTVNLTDLSLLPGFLVAQPGMFPNLNLPMFNLGSILPVSSSGNVPFTAAKLDTGPVGPAFDRATYMQNPGKQVVFFANWHAKGDLVQMSCMMEPCAWTTTMVPFDSMMDRVTALQFAVRAKTGHRTLYAAHKGVLSLIDLDAQNAQYDVDLNAVDTGYSPITDRGESPIAAIRAISIDPLRKDVFLEVKDTGANNGGNAKTFILQIRDDDLSSRNLADVHGDLHSQKLDNLPPIPAQFPDESHISVDSQTRLLRLVPNPNGAPTFNEFDITP